MATVADRPTARAPSLSRARIRLPLWKAVVLSRLLVLGAGAAGALFTPRISGWQPFDPERISSSLGSLGNVLAATAVRWDSIHYLQIAAHGYRSAGLTVFFPLYPLLIHLVALPLGSDVIAGVLISAVSFAVALVLLHRLTREELGEDVANVTVLLLAVAPLSFFFTAVYTESLFLALSVGAIYAAKHQRFVIAALVAAAATLTRVPGVLVAVPVAIFYIQARRQRTPALGPSRRTAAVLALPALALATFLGYLKTQGYGWLAPIANQRTSAHLHTMAGPLGTIVGAVRDGITGLVQTLHGITPIQPTNGGPFTLQFQNLIYLVVFAICVAALIAAWRRLPLAYAVYATLVLICCIWSPTEGLPMRSIDRYALVIFPLWMTTAAWLHKHSRARQLTMVSATLLGFYAFEAARWVFIA